MGRVQPQGGGGETVRGGCSGPTMEVEPTGCVEQLDMRCEGKGGVEDGASCLGQSTRWKEGRLHFLRWRGWEQVCVWEDSEFGAGWLIRGRLPTAGRRRRDTAEHKAPGWRREV